MKTLRWAKVEEFNPASPTQVLGYLKHKNYKIGLNRKTRRPTSDDEALWKLIGKHPEDQVLPLVLEARAYLKARGYLEDTYVGKDGALHPIFTFAPETGRLSSKAPNIQNQPQPRGHDAKQLAAEAIRKAVIARPGCLLVEADWKNIEAVLTGYFAEDPDYIRLSTLGSHSYLGLHIKGTPPDPSLSDEELRALFDTFKKDPAYHKAKTVNLACLTGDHEVLTPNGWVRLDAVGDGPTIAAWHPDGTLIWDCTLMHRLPYQGDLIGMEGSGIAARMTPNHRVPLYRNKVLKVDRADSLRYGRIPTSGMLPDVYTENADWLRLAAAIQADAHVTPNGTLWFNLKKARKHSRLEALLARLGVMPRISERPTGYKVYHIDKAVVQPALSWLSGPDKNFDLARLLMADREARLAFLEEVAYWDGSKETKTCFKYFTTNKHNAEVVQTVAHVTGKRALLRLHKTKQVGRVPCYIVRFSQRQFARVENTKLSTELSYNGTVYCPTVRTSFFLVRYKGAIFVTGNTGFGMGPRHLAEILGCTFTEAKRLLEIKEGMAPKVANWIRDTRRRAHKEHFLTNPMGYVSPYYFDVFRFVWEDSEQFDRVSRREPVYKTSDGRYYCLEQGSQANQVLAFLPQSTAAAMMREALLTFGEDGRLPMLATIHDAILFEVPKEKLSWALAYIREIMTRPWAELGGLRVGVDIKVGENWGEMNAA